MHDCQRIIKVLKDDPERKWGFVIYRCTYGDDAAWERFMTHMKMRTRLNLRRVEDYDIYSRLAWTVIEDPKLDEADDDVVRERFAQWTKTETDYSFGTARHQACVLVRKRYLDSVLAGPPPEKFDAKSEGYLELVSLHRDEGWTFVGASALLPRIYTLLEGPGWHNFALKRGIANP
ncbi:hypothetical protein K504DRAFT_466183 [Pleomassaria siparia CBS 279.74]|uniref:Uncharacterized protein n=1 Tax=Pleomassaria siparia CBS 279.74 TaxID=1314801 RepID=A0A6G1KE92_9PLEO|nr:hypothetical protein K504DRAFT_466183 [Pleomassaria siparia CBS 279.74]